jgi:hypothetical protein
MNIAIEHALVVTFFMYEPSWTMSRELARIPLDNQEPSPSTLRFRHRDWFSQEARTARKETGGSFRDGIGAAEWSLTKVGEGSSEIQIYRGQRDDGHNNLFALALAKFTYSDIHSESRVVHRSSLNADQVK